MVQFLSGDRLPLITAMEKAWQRDHLAISRSRRQPK
jgi:hypothetical protein